MKKNVNGTKIKTKNKAQCVEVYNQLAQPKYKITLKTSYYT